MLAITPTSFTTVTSSYRWDNGSPLSGISLNAATSNIINTVYVSGNIQGYAPYTCVNFDLQGVYNTDADVVYIIWDFNDYYNIKNNKALTVYDQSTLVSHTFCMPGVYTVTAIVQSVKDIYPADFAYNTRCVQGGKPWRWTDTSVNRVNETTWQKASIDNILWKSADECTSDYCLSWSWSQLSETSVTPMRWLDTMDVGLYAKTWGAQDQAQALVCTQSEKGTSITKTNTPITATFTITVLEKSPVANLYVKSVNNNTVTLSPEGCQCGSFPLQQIVYDFNDGSEVFIVDRFNIQQLLDTNLVTFNNSFSGDVNDPRNYDVLHAYNADFNNNIFYPCLSAVSCNTKSCDACSALVGPLELKRMNESAFNIVKTRSYDDTVLIVTRVDDYTNIHTCDLSEINTQKTLFTLKDQSPQHAIKNFPGKISNNNGYDGKEFVQLLLNNIKLK